MKFAVYTLCAVLLASACLAYAGEGKQKNEWPKPGHMVAATEDTEPKERVSPMTAFVANAKQMNSKDSLSKLLIRNKRGLGSCGLGCLLKRKSKVKKEARQPEIVSTPAPEPTARERSAAQEKVAEKAEMEAKDEVEEKVEREAEDGTALSTSGSNPPDVDSEAGNDAKDGVEDDFDREAEEEAGNDAGDGVEERAEEANREAEVEAKDKVGKVEKEAEEKAGNDAKDGVEERAEEANKEAEVEAKDKVEKVEKEAEEKVEKEVAKKEPIEVKTNIDFEAGESEKKSAVTNW